MFRRMIVGVCGVCVCASLAYAAGARVGKVKECDVLKLASTMDAVATLVFQPYDKDSLVGSANVSVVIQGFSPDTTYTVSFDRGGVGGTIETNSTGNGSFTGSNDGNSLDPTPVPGLPDNQLHVYGPDGNEVATGTVR